VHNGVGSSAVRNEEIFALAGTLPSVRFASNAALASGNPSTSEQVVLAHPGAASESHEGFTSTVTALTAAFGDPTRRDVFLHLRANPGSTATEVADAVSVHPNVARHHLDILVAGGYVHVEVGRRARSAGRPSKRFFAVDEDPTVEVLDRRDGLLVALLREALELLGPDAAEAMAAKVGEEYGRSLASAMAPDQRQRSVRAAMHEIASALTAHGFAAHAEDRDTTTAVVAEHCPFGDVAATHPVLCAADRGMVKGLLAGLCGEQTETAMPVLLSSRARGDATCAALA
jgi:predicted ArsR family transcriptional regulator